MKNRTLCLVLMALMVGMGMTGTAFAQCSAQVTGPACVDVVTNIGGGGPQGQVEVPQGVQSGSYGMRVRGFDGDNSETYVQIGAAAGVNQEEFFRAGFWVNTDDFDTTVHGARHFLVTTVGPSQSRPMRLMYIRNKNQDKHQIRGICNRNCAGGPAGCPNSGTGTLDLATGWNFVQMEWSINVTPAPGAPDGNCRISILSGGTGTTEVVGRYSQFDVRQVRLGMTGGVNIHPSTQGDMYFDDFAAFRTLAP